MPLWSCTDVFLQPPAVVFAFLQRPANRVRLAPPDWSLQLLSGPDRIEVGSVLIWRGRRKGISQTTELLVTALEQDRMMEEEQRRGPFRRWKQTFTFEAAAEGGTCLTERIDWEKPGGLLGLFVTESAVQQELLALQAHRQPLLAQLLAEERSGQGG